MVQRVAVTADAHLRTPEDTPERYSAFKNILEQLQSREINNLIVSGDLFDKGYTNYASFENFCREFPQIQIHIIPGNHDADLSSSTFVFDNVRVYEIPTVVDFDGVPFLLVPWEEGPMGPAIETKANELMGQNWVLVGHGDYIESSQTRNRYEGPTTYMPLFRNDVQTLAPRDVLLGHIHKPISFDNVHYAGSPHGLDITETGRRSYIVYDTNTGELSRPGVDTNVIYQHEAFTMVPVEDEIEKLKAGISARIKKWQLEPHEEEKVCVRIDARGYVQDRRAVVETLRNGFGRFEFYDGGPRVDQLHETKDDQRNVIAASVIEEINQLARDFDADAEIHDATVLKALHLIYQEV